MKKIILLVSIFAIVNMNAKSRSEMISQDLSKLGVSQEIILKTIELDKEMPNVVSEPDREKVKKLALKIEELLKKNEKNFVLSENLINIYNALGKSIILMKCRNCFFQICIIPIREILILTIKIMKYLKKNIQII